MARWLDERLGLGELLDAWLDAPAGAPSWARAFSVALGVCLAIAALSGVALGALYAPAGAGAWASVFFSEFQFPGGWLVRSMHVVSAEAALIFGAVALLLWVLEGRYRHQRDLSFWCLALVLGLAGAFCITGNPLRWDNRGYFGLVTEVNVMSEVPVVGRHVVVVGRGLTIGRPLANLLTLKRPDANAAVTVVHTGVADIGAYTRTADVVVAAAGSPGLITADMVRPGAAVVAAGVSFRDGRLLSDVDDAVAEVAGWLSPRVGGVGPMTRAMLLVNTVEAAERAAGVPTA